MNAGSFPVLALAVAALVGSVSGSAAAQPAAAEQDDPRARQFFEVGQQAYGKSEYLLAIEAFEHAYAIVQRPGLLFSLGQAHQRQFRARADELHLTAALDYYRRYLAVDTDGRRRGEALAAIESLTETAQRLRPMGTSAPSASIFGKLLVSSPTPGVVITVAGDRVETLPAALELPKNTYLVEASAPGYVSERRQVAITPGSAVPLNLELQARSASVQIKGPAGAEAFVDGRPVGFLPAPTLSLPAGEHWVSARRAGSNTRNEHVKLLRGETATLDLPLEMSSQRRTAWVVGASGAVALLATGVFAAVALERDNAASDLENQRTAGQLSRDQAEQLNSAVDGRDAFRRLAIVGGITSAALVGTALVLYVSDTPAPPTNQRFEAARTARRFELRPLAVPAAWGASLTRHF